MHSKLLPACAALLLLSHLMLPVLAVNCTAPPSFNNFDVNSCCRMPEINLGSVPQKCQKQVNKLKSADEKYPAHAHLCYPDCIYQKTGSLINGSLQMNKVQAYLYAHVHQRDRDIVPHIVKSFSTCVDSIHEHMRSNHLDSYKVLAQGCSPYAAMIYSCVNAEIFLNCPAKMWKSHDLCQEAKQYARMCNPLPHVPLPVS